MELYYIRACLGKTTRIVLGTICVVWVPTGWCGTQWMEGSLPLPFHPLSISAPTSSFLRHSLAESYHVAQDGLELAAIHLPQCPGCWDYRHAHHTLSLSVSWFGAGGVKCRALRGACGCPTST